jgi:hypothetical protein
MEVVGSDLLVIIKRNFAFVNYTVPKTKISKNTRGRSLLKRKFVGNPRK